MSGLIVIGDLDNYRRAGAQLGTSAAAGDVPRLGTPDLGHAGAEAAMGEFASRMADYHASLTQASSDGAASVARLVANFEAADRLA